jgi:phospholipase C
MDTRREFLKKAALLSGGASLMNMLPPVIQKAMAINPAPGSTFYDAEHIVFLMQENRSFDHIFGSLQGVRGFNDPRAIRLPNGNPVWLQTDKNGNTFSPFRLNTQESKVAWMGSLPHGWSDQSDARNDGKYDRWLEVKRSRNKGYADMPLTLGFCNRADFPFYYSLADAFTVCDQHFCSSITGTHPNRYYWMSGSIRDNPNDHNSKAHVWNITDYYKPELGWKTFPERLQEIGVSWKHYQNDLTMGRAFGLPNEAWLGNFGTNVLEYFKQYNVRLEAGRIALLQQKKENTLQLIDSLQNATDEASKTKLTAAKKLLSLIEAEQQLYNTARYDQLSALEKEMNGRAFVTNANDPGYREMERLEYTEANQSRWLDIPKADTLYQFREDVQNGRLPAVSWLSSPANFSDHPSLPWFGPWYVSEVMEILLKNPEVWKKTVVILTYDENDGFFDHFAPFVVPDPYKKQTGKVSAGIDPGLDFATIDQQVNPSATNANLRSAPIGLGYRVPMIIASPWTRGGYVCSEVFDHTSSIQFLEKFIGRKTGKKIVETNISSWRRTICGDLSSAFRQNTNKDASQPAFIDRIPFIEHIHDAQYKDLPGGYKKLSDEEIAAIKNNPSASPHLPKQETGIRSACALPYELYVDGIYNEKAGTYALHFSAGNQLFGKEAAGAPFYVYAVMPNRADTLQCRNYAVSAGDRIQDEWELGAFEKGNYHLRTHGPNGFYREFKGDDKNPLVSVAASYEKIKGGKGLTGNLIISLHNNDASAHKITIRDNSYKKTDTTLTLRKGEQKNIVLDLSKNHGWYDLSVTAEGKSNFEERFAGKVETGKEGKTDPLMGGVVVG